MECMQSREEQLSALIDSYGNLVFSICYKMTSDYFASEDLSQETFLSAYKHLSEFDGQYEKAWICRIATNKCLDYLNSAGKADYIFQTDSDGQTLPEEFWQMWNNRHNYDFQIGTRGGRQDGASRVFVTKTLRLVVWLMFHVWVKDANTPFRLMKADKLIPILNVIPQDYNLANVAVSAIAVRWHYNIGWYPITFRPRQGGVNSINMKRIFKIGVKALTDFRTINRNLK